MPGYRPIYNKTNVYEIQYGPAHKIICTVVKYRDNRTQLKWHVDLRLYHWNATKRHYMATPKGVTFSQKVCLEMQNAMLKLPEDVSDLKEKEHRIFAKIQEHQTVWMCIGAVRYEQEYRLDLREWLIDVHKGYEGFTVKGLRMDYVLKDQVFNMLSAATNLMFTYEEEDRGKVPREFQG